MIRHCIRERRRRLCWNQAKSERYLHPADMGKHSVCMYVCMYACKCERYLNPVDVWNQCVYVRMYVCRKYKNKGRMYSFWDHVLAWYICMHVSIYVSSCESDSIQYTIVCAKFNMTWPHPQMEINECIFFECGIIIVKNRRRDETHCEGSRSGVSSMERIVANSQVVRVCSILLCFSSMGKEPLARFNPFLQKSNTSAHPFASRSDLFVRSFSPAVAASTLCMEPSWPTVHS